MARKCPMPNAQCTPMISTFHISNKGTTMMKSHYRFAFLILGLFSFLFSTHSCEAWSAPNRRTPLPKLFQRHSSAPFRRHTQKFQLKSNRDDKEPPKYNMVEEGSPIGVAIVVIGGSLVVFGGDDFLHVPIWVVFATASIAAGISRLVRNTK